MVYLCTKEVTKVIFGDVELVFIFKWKVCFGKNRIYCLVNPHADLPNYELSLNFHGHHTCLHSFCFGPMCVLSGTIGYF